jgi:hypothetical protein
MHRSTNDGQRGRRASADALRVVQVTFDWKRTANRMPIVMIVTASPDWLVLKSSGSMTGCLILQLRKHLSDQNAGEAEDCIERM